ncbi:hypothetical protein [Mesorhizobium sp.]|uniref:hypothetical protein n=1 Tax=Mesorhizobium sp. TaxID=1871066 RepID=UPI000FE8D67D|nr:hypothetical protein [Mesorhizobium sp.]RWI11859.1 MAG: hypothetical protein EOQ92_32350 [Mesorhizobium sp.]RWK46560.1 MAG: hypothetical protein EOR47_25300 [Mesorhizobium sp.]RWK92912.1 MAG: hypothetical protein EOR53_25240 [Mesorhizobium sp.]TIP54634.1 MAG: hypothetical protein E5X56_31780 [Mesorhizobium sp.]TIQ25727.1 MAG: hypothetical protein E5X54_28765 [Mesorhizobium sp.]
MFFLTLCFVAIAVPYGIERFYFVIRFGFFAAIFWLFVFQASVLFGGEIILENHLGHSLPNWATTLGFAIGAFAYMTIGLTSFAAVVAALGFGTVIAAKWFLRKLAENSN